MKNIRTILLLAALSAAASIRAAEQPADAPPKGESVLPSGTNAPSSGEPSLTLPTPAPPIEPAAGSLSVPATVINGEASLRLNFRGVPLDMVLNYLSEAAGFIINVKPGANVRGKVDVWSSTPLTKAEALNVLDTVLNQNGLAAVHNGRTLTIVNRDEAKTQPIPVVQGGDPQTIPSTDQIVTQIIPVRFVEVAQLVKDLQPLVSVQTTITANESGNSIVITDTQANIRRVAEVIKGIDTGAEAFTEVRVFRLTHADPVEMADELSNLFPDDSRSGSNQGPVFAGFRRFLGGGGFGGQGGGNTGGAGDANQRIKKRARVIAVADPRTASVIVTAAKDLMEQIEGVIADLDANPRGQHIVTVIPVPAVDPQELQQVLTDTFASSTQNNRNNATQNDPLMSRASQQSQQGSSSSATRSSSLGGSRGVGGGGSTLP